VSNTADSADTSTGDDTGNATSGPASRGSPPNVGQLIITEFMADPAAVAVDQGESVVPPGGSLILVRSSNSGANGGLDGLAMSDAFTLNHNDVIITSATEGASEIFSEMVPQGASGAGIEIGYYAARLGLSESLHTSSSQDVGFSFSGVLSVAGEQLMD
jgi:hypothetical protein